MDEGRDWAYWGGGGTGLIGWEDQMPRIPLGSPRWMVMLCSNWRRGLWRMVQLWMEGVMVSSGAEKLKSEGPWLGCHSGGTSSLI